MLGQPVATAVLQPRHSPTYPPNDNLSKPQPNTHLPPPVAPKPPVLISPTSRLSFPPTNDLRRRHPSLPRALSPHLLTTQPRRPNNHSPRSRTNYPPRQTCHSLTANTANHPSKTPVCHTPHLTRPPQAPFPASRLPPRKNTPSPSSSESGS